MMLDLLGYVLRNIIDVRLAHAESRVTSLPSERAMQYTTFMNPAGRICLDDSFVLKMMWLRRLVYVCPIVWSPIGACAVYDGGSKSSAPKGAHPINAESSTVSGRGYILSPLRGSIRAQKKSKYIHAPILLAQKE
jgi:hypothetical protein